MGWILHSTRVKCASCSLQENGEITEDMYEKILEEILIPRDQAPCYALAGKDGPVDQTVGDQTARGRLSGTGDRECHCLCEQVTTIWMMTRACKIPHPLIIRPASSRMRMTQDLLQKGDRSVRSYDQSYGRRIGSNATDEVDRSFIAEERLCSGECNEAGKAKIVSFPYAERLRIQ